MTLTVTAAAEFGSPPKVLVEVGSSPSVTNVLRVFRVHEDGSRNRVLTSGRALLNGSWSGYDYHAPTNQSFTYVASTGVQADSAPSGPVFIPSGDFWLVHPADPDLSVLASTVLSVGARKLGDRSQSFQVLGRSTPVFRWSSPRAASVGDFSFLVEGQQEVAAVEALFADGGSILMNSSRSDVLAWNWVQPGDVSIEPPGGYYRTDLRTVSFSWTVCAAPDVDVKPVWTLGDLKAEFVGSTLADIKPVWASYGDMRIDRRA